MTMTSVHAARLPAGFDRRWTVGTLIRGLVFVLAELVVLLLAESRAAGTAGADGDVGAGLLLVALGLSGAAVWAAVDGHRLDRFRPVLTRWAVVAVVAGCFPPLYRALGGGPQLSVLGSDLVGAGGFTATVVLGAATLGCLVGVLTDRRPPRR